MKLEFIREQTEWVDKYTESLVKDLGENECGVVKFLETGINWQIGHIVVSKHFHSIQSIDGSDGEISMEINEKVPTKELFKHYSFGSDPNQSLSNGFNKTKLMDFLKEVNTGATKVLETLSEKDFDRETAIQNPAAKTIYDALTFTFKHQMWHNGQIAMIKRIVQQKN